MNHAACIVDQNVDVFDFVLNLLTHFLHLVFFTHFPQNQVNLLIPSFLNDLIDSFLPSLFISTNQVDGSIEFCNFFGSSAADSAVRSSDDKSFSSHVSCDFREGFLPFGEGFVASVHKLNFSDELHFGCF